MKKSLKFRISITYIFADKTRATIRRSSLLKDVYRKYSHKKDFMSKEGYKAYCDAGASGSSTLSIKGVFQMKKDKLKIKLEIELQLDGAKVKNCLNIDDPNVRKALRILQREVDTFSAKISI